MSIGSKERGPLAGIRIFDMTQWMVGPWATMLLGSMGAEVLHLEQPDVDWSQLSAGVPPTINGTSIGYLSWNMNKRGVFMDMKDEHDRAFAHKLIETCDVFVCNMRTGVAERLGMAYEELSKINPGLVYCSATGYGRIGPRANERGTDSTVQALTGFWSTQGARGEAPEKYRHYTQLDASTGNTIAQGVLLGLYARKRTGKGQKIDITMLDAGATAQVPRLAEHFAGVDHAPQGSSAFATAPDRAFLCENDRWIGVSVTSDAQWASLCRVLGNDELAADERFATNKDRVSNRDALEKLLVPLFREHPQTYWILQLQAAGVPFGTPLEWEVLKNHRQVIENGYLQEIDTPAWGPHWTGGPPWQFSKTPAHMEGAPIPGDATFELQEEVAKREAGKA